MIGKLATGTGLAAGRRERAFFERVAPAWDSGAPALLGACELGTTDDVAPRLLLVTEDLGAIGYRVRGTAVSPAELAGAIDALASLYARFWDAVPVEYLDGDFDAESVTRCARAWPPELAVRHGGAARAAAAEFLAGEGVACSPNERALLEDILTAWPGQRAARVAAGRALTLIHADFHFLGNVLFRDHDPRPRIIDWSELKPGLGPHDVAYCLTPIATDDRPARDRALLRRYWDGLRAHGVDDYPWELCRWDHQFSLITNLLQALFQASLMWFRHGVAMIEAHDCRTVLTVPPPRGS
ncbi:MAG TPA: phosphotransferase [Kofleriaceae bacterium]|nr:phosphotransferase [Kofleriaceae bacterium]